jgi:predicted ester cyclase
MEPHELKELSRRYFEVWGTGDLDAERAVVEETIVDHNAFVGWSQGLEGHHRRLLLFNNAFSEWEHTLVHQLTDGELVVEAWAASGRHTGDLLGIPPTGKRVSMSGIDILRFKDGRVTDIWHQEDLLSVFVQIGVMPPAAAESEYTP